MTISDVTFKHEWMNTLTMCVFLAEIVHVNPQFKVTLKEDSCVVVSVMQSYKAPRKKKQFISCASLLYRVSKYIERSSIQKRSRMKE